MSDLTLEKHTELIDLWKHHEAIAMHFNDLISKIRIQALGGTAAIGAIAAAIGHASGGAFDYFLFGCCCAAQSSRSWTLRSSSTR